MDLLKDTKAKEQALFTEWKGQYTDFITDGLFNESAYSASSLRVVFGLKEPYDDTSPLGEAIKWDLCKHLLEQEAKGHTWVTVARWCYGLQNLHRDVPWVEVQPYGNESHPDKLKLLKNVGIMNMKKVPGRKAPTNMLSFREFTERPENLDYLRRQWDLYTPQLTVCASGDTFNVLTTALGASPADFRYTSRNQRYWVNPNGQFLLETCHPAAQYPPAMKYYMLLDAARELLTNKVSTKGCDSLPTPQTG